MVLVLLDLRDDFCNFASLGEVNKFRIMQKVGISLLEEQDIGLVLAKKRNAWGIN